VPAGGGGGGGEGGSALGLDGLGQASSQSASSASSRLRRRLPSHWALPAARGCPGLRSPTWWWWPSPPSEVVNRYFVTRLSDLLICYLVPDGEAGVPVKTEPEFFLGGRWRCLHVATLMEASSLQLSSLLGYSGGNPRSGSPRSDDSNSQCCSPPWGHHFWSRQWLELVLRWSGVSLSMSTTVGLGGMVPWSLDGGRVLRCARRAEAPSSPVVALMVGSVRSSLRSITLEMGQRKVVEATSEVCAQGPTSRLC
jgi:hypothetical protein